MSTKQRLREAGVTYLTLCAFPIIDTGDDRIYISFQINNDESFYTVICNSLSEVELAILDRVKELENDSRSN